MKTTPRAAGRHDGQSDFFTGAKLPEFKVEWVGIVAVMILAVLGPLRAFVPKLSALKRSGLREYGTLAQAGEIQAGFFGPKGDSTKQKQASVRQQRDEMLAQLYATNPEMKKRIKKAAGYATFSPKDINLFLRASGNGCGVLRDNKARKDIFMRMASLGGGLGLGVKDVRVIFVFNDSKVMQHFVEEGWQFGGKADASAKYKAADLAGKVFNWEEKRTKLKRTWFKKFSKVVPAKKAAQFFQIENQLHAALDLRLAASLPLIK